MEFTYKSQADITAMTDEAREDYASKKRTHEDSLVEKTAKEQAELAVKEVKEELETVKKANADLVTKKDFDELSSTVKKNSQMSINEPKELSLKGMFASVIKENTEKVKSFKGEGKVVLSTKELAPINFGTAANYTEFFADRLPGVYRDPYAPVWLRNIFPNASTSGDSIAYLKRVASTGKAAVWTRDGETPKPDITPNFIKATAPVDWIAGLADVPREMLADASFLQTYIPNELIYGEDGILAAENEYIMDYIDANAVDYTEPAANFDPLTIPIEKLVAAAFGQIGSKYMQASHILINNWDYVSYIALNKASASGVYDLPNMSLSFVDGEMFINRLKAVPVPSITPGTGYVVAANASTFVTRMSTEVQMFEQHKDNVAMNLVTFRAEERVAFFTTNTNSMVKVVLNDGT